MSFLSFHRPDLTWRDIQHLCVRSAQMVNPEDPDWETTAAGRQFSYKYGYGKLDAYHYVTAAQSWQNVKPQAWFDIPAIQIAGGRMNILNEMSGGELIVPGGVRSSTTVTKAMMERCEFREVGACYGIKVWISHTKRGDVEVELVSPNGIKSVLAAPRGQIQQT
jgi:kexin